MKITKRLAKQAQRRRWRVRNAVRRAAHGRPRLSVYRSNKHISVQLIDDTTGTTLAAVSSQQSGVLSGDARGSNSEGAKAVGAQIAAKAKEHGVSDVVFDRGNYKYHGRVAALADAAREGGLNF